MKRFAIILMAVIMVMAYIPMTAGTAFADEELAPNYKLEVTELPLYAIGDEITVKMTGENLADYVNNTPYDGEIVMIPWQLTVSGSKPDKIDFLREEVGYLESEGEDPAAEPYPDYSFESLIDTSKFVPGEDGSLNYTCKLTKSGKMRVTLALNVDSQTYKNSNGYYYTLRYNGTEKRWEVLDKEGNPDHNTKTYMLSRAVYYSIKTVRIQVQSWRPGEEKTITFNANKGTCSTKTKTVVNGETYGKLPKATRSGYFFKGWYTSKSGGTKVFSTTQVKLSKDKTLYAHWSSTYSETIEYSETPTLKAGETYKYEFSTDNSMLFLMPWDINTTSGKKITSGGLIVSIEDKAGNGYGTLEFDLSGDKEWHGDFHTTKKLKARNYVITVTNTSNKKYTFHFKLTGYYGNAIKGSFKKKVTNPADEWIKIGTLKKGFPTIKKINSSKKSIVNDYVIDYDGSIYVLGLKKGSSDITVTLKNGTKYKTTVNVTDPEPYFSAYISGKGSDSTGNYLKVKITNGGARDLTIIRKGAVYTNKLLNWGGTCYIKDTTTVTVKSGATKTVKFHSDTSFSGYDGVFPDYEFDAKFTYGGITYDWMIEDGNGSIYKKGSDWYQTC